MLAGSSNALVVKGIIGLIEGELCLHKSKLTIHERVLGQIVPHNTKILILI